MGLNQSLGIRQILEHFRSFVHFKDFLLNLQLVMYHFLDQYFFMLTYISKGRKFRVEVREVILYLLLIEV